MPRSLSGSSLHVLRCGPLCPRGLTHGRWASGSITPHLALRRLVPPAAEESRSRESADSEDPAPLAVSLADISARWACACALKARLANSTNPWPAGR